jgi:hypothetical protein
MWLLVLEALVALGMLILIVWLTMSKPQRRDAEANDAPPDPGPGSRDKQS